MTNYASIEVDQLVIHGNDFLDHHAVPKTYVDTAVGSATARIDTLVEGSVPAFDTLIELKNLMDSNQGDIGTALTARVSEFSAAIEDEAGAARGFENDIRMDLGAERNARVDAVQEVREAVEQEMLDRETHVQEVRDALSAETFRSEEADLEMKNRHDAYTVSNNGRIAEVQGELSTSITSLSDTTQEGLGTKLDKSEGYSKRSDGALLIENDHYLYLGTNWRLRASQGSKRQRLEFEYSANQNTWDLAVPFIRGT